jgi:hypothetical protein
MYGMINDALRTLVLARSNDEVWRRVVRRAGVDDSAFHSMTAYPDDVTYKLVGAASDELGVSSDELLRDFGVHWVLVTAPSTYGSLMDFTGRSFVEFLSNLDRMHDRVATLFRNLQQPSFECERIGPGSVRLHYRSHRAGLTPFVVGLLEGLGRRFAITVSVRVVQSKSDGASHDVFAVEYPE